MSEAAFRDGVLAPLFGRLSKRIDLERIELPPLLTVDDHFFFSVVQGMARSGMPSDRSPPFRVYRMNTNAASARGNPFQPYFERWYQR
jgi:hypothetical protein